MSTKEYFAEAYSFSGEPDGHPNIRQGIRVHFIRWSMMPLFRDMAKGLVTLFDWPRDAKILIVGGAFGWLTEILEDDYGFTHLLTLDDSPYIQHMKDQSEDEEIDEAIRAVGLDPTAGEGLCKKKVLCDGLPRCRTKRGIITQATGRFDIVLTERVLSTLTDQEALELSAKYNQMTDNLVHLVQPLIPEATQDEGYNWKLAKDWKVLLPNDSIIDSHSWEAW